MVVAAMEVLHKLLKFQGFEIFSASRARLKRTSHLAHRPPPCTERVDMVAAKRSFCMSCWLSTRVKRELGPEAHFESCLWLRRSLYASCRVLCYSFAAAQSLYCGISNPFLQPL